MSARKKSQQVTAPAPAPQPAAAPPPKRPPGVPSRWRPWLPLIALTCVAALMRLARLGSMGLWFDEIHTLTESAFPNAWSAPHQLFFRLDHLFQRLSSDPTVAVRIFPALCGVAAIPVIYAWVARLASKPAALLAAAIVCFQPFHVFQSQEGRFYAPMILFSATALWGLTRWMTTPGGARWVAALVSAGAAIVSPMNHPSAAPLAMALALFAVSWAIITREGRAALNSLVPPRLDQPHIRRALVVIAAVALLVGLALLRAPITRAARLVFKSEWGATPGVDLSWNFFSSHLVLFGWDFSRFPGFGGLAGLANAGLVTLGAALLFRRSRASALALLTVILATFLAVFAYQTDHAYDKKYVAYLQPIVVAMIAISADDLIQRAARFLRAKSTASARALAAIVQTLPVCATVFAFAMLPGLVHYYRGAKMPLRSQFDWLNRMALDSSEVFVYGHTGFPAALYRNDLALRHHLNYFPWRETAGLIEREVMLTRADMGGPVYFAHAWPHDVPDRLMDWLQSNAEPAVRIPSLMGQQNTGVLFKVPRRQPPSISMADRPAAWISNFHPPGRPQVIPDDSGGMNALELRANVTLDYPYSLKKGQLYELELDVEPLVPGRYFLMAGATDQHPILLGGDLVPGQNTRLRGVFESAADAETLQISYASDYAMVSEGRGVKLKRVHLRAGASDQPPHGFIPLPKPATLGPPWVDQRGVAADWTFSPQQAFSLDPARQNDERLVIHINRMSKEKPIGRMVSPVFRVGAGDLVAFRSQARLMEGYGLSISPALYLLNSAGGLRAQIAMSSSSLSQSVNWDPWVQELLEDPWVTFEGAINIPEGATYAAVAFMVWETNGQRRVDNAANEVHMRPFSVSILKAGASPAGLTPLVIPDDPAGGG